MRVLWLVRANLTQHPGGDTTQILRTADALRRCGVKVDLTPDSRVDMRGYDLGHLFHLDRLWENGEHCRRLRAAGLPVVLSTIYWPSDEFDRKARTGFQGFMARCLGSARYQNLRMFQRHLLHWRERGRRPRLPRRGFDFRRSAVDLLRSVAVLLPNSRIEARQIEEKFGVRRPFVAVPNAADAGVFKPPAEPAPPRTGVLCIGRIEPRKNQHALIEALRDTGIPLTLVGGAGRYSGAYYRRCRRAAGASTRFVDPQPPEGLARLCHGALVHACVSWYETPGLVSMEAALCGCALVATPGGSTREYLADDASYAEPDDVESIRQAVREALERGPSEHLAERIRREYTWQAAAEKTLEGYRLALEEGPLKTDNRQLMTDN